MTIIRNVLAVVIGYAIFVVSAVMLFQLSGIDAHADPSVGVMLLVIGYGLVFSFLGGYVARMTASAQGLLMNYVLAVLMAGFAMFSLFKSGGNHYSQLAAIFLFAPASVVGGWARLRAVSGRRAA